jgi:hypothetical protein
MILEYVLVLASYAVSPHSSIPSSLAPHFHFVPLPCGFHHAITNHLLRHYYSTSIYGRRVKVNLKFALLWQASHALMVPRVEWPVSSTVSLKIYFFLAPLKFPWFLLSSWEPFNSKYVV